jgi:four helix bundle protein
MTKVEDDEQYRARSRADFGNKTRICESEASETQCWLEVIGQLKWLFWVKIETRI